MESGLIFNVQRYSVQDGPGIRTTVFFKGCPLNCAWCHNPEGISPRREVAVIHSRCVRCGACHEVCRRPSEPPPDGAGDLTRRTPCLVCGSCVEACPTGARQWVGRQVSVSGLMKEILADRIFYEDSGGGVTFSGGEPLLQSRFLAVALAACRSEGIHTAVDTCGHGSPDDLLTLAPHTDLFLYDLKLIDDARHRACTGVSNARILSNLRALAERRATLWIRMPVIPGLNDDLPNLEATAALVSELPAVQEVQLLPYHPTALDKLSRLGRPASPHTIPTPNPQQMAAAAAVFRARGIATRIGG